MMSEIGLRSRPLVLNEGCLVTLQELRLRPLEQIEVKDISHV